MWAMPTVLLLTSPQSAYLRYPQASAYLPTESRALHPQNQQFDQSSNTDTNHMQKDEFYSPQYPNIPALWEAVPAVHKLLLNLIAEHKIT